MIESNQTIEDWQDCKSEHKKWSQNAIEDYQMIKDDINQLIAFVNQIDDVDNLSPLDGTGSPEGVETANISKFYVDTAVPTLYFNPVIGADTGWVAL